jgi:hypothetical protein
MVSVDLHVNLIVCVLYNNIANSSGCAISNDLLMSGEWNKKMPVMT